MYTCHNLEKSENKQQFENIPQHFVLLVLKVMFWCSFHFLRKINSIE